MTSSTDAGGKQGPSGTKIAKSAQYRKRKSEQEITSQAEITTRIGIDQRISVVSRPSQ